MLWPQLLSGTLIKRYKRFIADIELHGTGEVISAYCPNTGSMLLCSEPGRTVYCSLSDNPKRKLAYTWELIQMQSSLVGINTARTNSIALEAIQNKEISELKDFEIIQPEVTVSKSTRLDALLGGPQNRECYMEIKNCTLVEDGTAMFPDAVTIRGQKHLQALMHLRSLGHKALLFFLVQRTDGIRFSPADRIDPAYGRLLRQAVSHGVEILAYDVDINLTSLTIRNPLSIVL